MWDTESTYYYYTRNGKEFFTSNRDLALSRAEEGTELRIIKINTIT
jgi:hypothetical protein